MRKMFVDFETTCWFAQQWNRKQQGRSARKETYDLLVADQSLNFVGNVARDLMNGVADVVVTDGFTGNAVLKSIEGTALGIMGLLKNAITGGGLERS